MKGLELMEDVETVYATRLARYLWLREECPESWVALPPAGAVLAALIDALRWASALEVREQRLAAQW